MPFSYTCDDHPAWHGSAAEDILRHAAADHPMMTAQRAMSTTGPIRGRYETQNEARGVPAIRIFGCPSCGKRIEAKGPTDRYCGGDRCVG